MQEKEAAEETIGPENFQNYRQVWPRTHGSRGNLRADRYTERRLREQTSLVPVKLEFSELFTISFQLSFLRSLFGRS